MSTLKMKVEVRWASNKWEKVRYLGYFFHEWRLLRFCGDIDKLRFLQIVKYLLKCSFHPSLVHFPIVHCQVKDVHILWLQEEGTVLLWQKEFSYDIFSILYICCWAGKCGQFCRELVVNMDDDDDTLHGPTFDIGIDSVVSQYH